MKTTLRYIELLKNGFVGSVETAQRNCVFRMSFVLYIDIPYISMRFNVNTVYMKGLKNIYWS